MSAHFGIDAGISVFNFLNGNTSNDHECQTAFLRRLFAHWLSQQTARQTRCHHRRSQRHRLDVRRSWRLSDAALRRRSAKQRRYSRQRREVRSLDENPHRRFHSLPRIQCVDYAAVKERARLGKPRPQRWRRAARRIQDSRVRTWLLFARRHGRPARFDHRAHRS